MEFFQSLMLSTSCYSGNFCSFDFKNQLQGDAVSFKKQVEISLVNLMQLDPKSKSIKIGSIENLYLQTL